MSASTAAYALHYASFWARLKAAIVDFGLFLPIIVLTYWAMEHGLWVNIAANVTSMLVWFAYAIVAHAVWGQTIGKRVARIRVVDTRGVPIGWTRAWRRSAVDIVLGSASTIGYYVTLRRIPSAELEALNWFETVDRVAAIRPAWAAAAEYLYLAWLGSEIVSVLFNRQRRALHDFVAGTAVVYTDTRTSATPAPRLPVWRLALVWGNTIVSVAAAGGAVILTVVALVEPGLRAESPAGVAIVAGLLVFLTIAFAVAAYDHRRASRRAWVAQAIAIAVSVLFVLPLLV